MAATDVLRDEDATVVVEADGSTVESLVMERAERETVVGGIGSTCGVPFNVRGLDAEVGSLELAIIATDGAPVFVDSEDRVAEGRVAFERAAHRYPRHPDRVENIFVVGGLPMGFEELLSDLIDKVWSRSKCLEEVFG